MLQRIQSVFLFFSSMITLIMIFFVPIFEIDSKEMFASDFLWAKVFLFISAILSLISINLYKNRKKQILLCSFSRTQITIALILLLFIYKKELNVKIELLLFAIPYLLLILSSYFIKKDEKLVKSSERIR
ncbi:MAG: DUF4293 family protein [Flavobacteriales bacterium TMED84]|nr:MAG: DUF4293 family protein [Flavobacteriales bacterium TMED84]